jgi:uncharacterized membrane protein (UPF0127 family)
MTRPRGVAARIGLVSLVTAGALVAGCGRAPAAQTTVRIGVDSWTVLIADHDGMRGRADFEGADGMLFDLDRDVPPGTVHFVMDGVAFPLDIAWFEGDGDLAGTASMATCPAKPCPKYAPEGAFRWAVEAPVGAFDDLDPGARLEVP